MTTPLDVPDSHRDLANGPHTAILTTVGPAGDLQSTVVWYLVGVDGVLRTSITTNRQKAKNLARDPRATLFVLDPTNPMHGLEVRATVERLTPDPDKTLLPAIAERYGVPLAMLADLPGERVIATFTPTRVRADG